jgi:hypothetical protein
MPADFRWDSGSRILRTRLWGHVTNEDIVGHALNVVADPSIRAPLQELIDCTGVESTRVTSEGLRNIVQIDVAHKERYRGQRTAIVAPTDEILSMARTFATLSEVHHSPHRIRIFRTLPEAEDWLKSPDSEGGGISATPPPSRGR